MVILVAPRYLGLLRERLAASVKCRLVAEIDNDLVHRETDEIAAAIGHHL